MESEVYNITDERLAEIINTFRCEPTEQEHVEFKVGNFSHEYIGKCISAISNTLTRRNIPRGYIIWGIEDGEGHGIVGTNFHPERRKVGNEDLVLWLSKNVQPDPNCYFRELTIEDKRVVVLIIVAGIPAVSKFQRVPYIRVGANIRPLVEFPTIEQDVWAKVSAVEFESRIALHCQTEAEVRAKLDFETITAVYQERFHLSPNQVFEYAIQRQLVRNGRDGTFDITNLGALLYARNLQDFPHLSSKAVRVVKYQNKSKLDLVSDWWSNGGYIVEFSRIYQYIMNQIIAQEVIDEQTGLRRQEYLYPGLVIRELLANTITHQDLSTHILYPMVEIFADRIEFTNAGAPLIPVERLVDFPPKTRNRKMADEMVCARICESLGSGWDKITDSLSGFGFPIPRPKAIQDTTKVVVVQRRSLENMTTTERLWTIYMYACLLSTRQEYLTNSGVRDLFGLSSSSASMASNLLNQAVKAGYIAVFDQDAGNRNRKYQPVFVEE